MLPPRFASDGGHVRVHIQDAAGAVHVLELVKRFQQLVKTVFGTHVGDQRDLFIAAAGRDAQLGKLRHQRHRQVIHAVVVQVLQYVRRAALSCTGQTGYD